MNRILIASAGVLALAATLMAAPGGWGGGDRGQRDHHDGPRGHGGWGLVAFQDRGGPPGPPDGRGGPGGPPPGMDDRRGPDGRGGPPGMDDRRGGPGGPRPEMRQAEMLRSYLELVDRFATLSKDPDSAGIAAVLTAGEILRPRGPQAAIEFFEKNLPSARSPAVAIAMRLQLVEAYRQSDQPDKALNELQTLMMK